MMKIRFSKEYNPDCICDICKTSWKLKEGWLITQEDFIKRPGYLIRSWVGEFWCPDCTNSCSVCGEKFQAEAMNFCDDCGSPLCQASDCEMYVNSLDVYVCRKCFEDNYCWCDSCEYTVRSEDVSACHHCGEYVCESCYQADYSTHRVYCKHCMEEHVQECDQCSSIKPKEELKSCESCGDIICEECRDGDKCDLCGAKDAESDM